MEWQSKSWEEKCGERERKLSGRETAVKDNATFTTKVNLNPEPHLDQGLETVLWLLDSVGSLCVGCTVGNRWYVSTV